MVLSERENICVKNSNAITCLFLLKYCVMYDQNEAEGGYLYLNIVTLFCLGIVALAVQMMKATEALNLGRVSACMNGYVIGVLIAYMLHNSI